jgi:Tol biopolymer transport system component
MPDGQSLLCLKVGSTPQTLGLLSLASGQFIRISTNHTPAAGENVKLSPDGTLMVFVARGERELDVFVALVAGHGPEIRVTDNPERETNVIWPQGGREIFLSLGGLTRRNTHSLGAGFQLDAVLAQPSVGRERPIGH